MNPADIAASGLASPAMEVSLLGMFWSAHFVVKLVMVGLLAASVWCWAIIINKVLLFVKTNRAMAQFEDVFWSGASLDELYATLSSRPASGMAALFVAAMREWRRSVQGASSSFMGLQARIEKVLDVSIAREVEKLESSLLVLATVASAGPFIGLFGTVWGIMTSFKGIGETGSASLAVVAPGIAEALIATAIGLVAAIPAVMGYNHFQHKIKVLIAEMDSFSTEFLNIVQRTFAGK